LAMACANLGTIKLALREPQGRPALFGPWLHAASTATTARRVVEGSPCSLADPPAALLSPGNRPAPDIGGRPRS
jgi:hypothetical protein